MGYKFPTSDFLFVCQHGCGMKWRGWLYNLDYNTYIYILIIIHIYILYSVIISVTLQLKGWPLSLSMLRHHDSWSSLFMHFMGTVLDLPFQPDSVRFGNASACRVCARGGSGRVIMVMEDTKPHVMKLKHSSKTVDEIWNLPYKSRICKNKQW